MISQTVEYALRAIVTIAQHEGEPCTARKIAKITQVPSAYLSKLMQGLVRSGLVNSQRGLHGGFVLTKNPRELTIWNDVDAVERNENASPSARTAEERNRNAAELPTSDNVIHQRF